MPAEDSREDFWNTVAEGVHEGVGGGFGFRRDVGVYVDGAAVGEDRGGGAGYEADYEHYGYVCEKREGGVSEGYEGEADEEEFFHSHFIIALICCKY